MSGLRDQWISPHPIPDWVAENLPSNPGRIKVIERAALIEDTGHVVLPGCQLCAKQGFECKILKPAEGVKVRCARCTNQAKVCSLSNDQDWDSVAAAFFRAENEGEAEGNYDDQDEEEGEEKGGYDNGDDEEEASEKLGAIQIQDFEGSMEHVGQGNDDRDNEEHHLIPKIEHTIRHPHPFIDIHDGRKYWVWYDATMWHSIRVYVDE